MTFDFSDLSGQRFEEDLQRAAQYKPIVKADLNKAYGRYRGVGVKLGRVKGKSDAQLYKMATQDVIAWWKKSKAQKAKPSGTAPNSTLPRGGATPTGSGGGSGGSSFSGGSTGGSGGSLLPDTSTSAKGSAPKNLPKIPQPLSQSYMQQQYARYGIVNARPPSYVLKNRDTFDAWILRVLRERDAAAPATVINARQGQTSRPRII